MPKIRTTTVEEATIRGVESIQNESISTQEQQQADIDFALALLGADAEEEGADN